jgi:sulfur carrier protein
LVNRKGQLNLTPFCLSAPLAPACMEDYDPARMVEIKGPKKAKDLLRELNLVVEAHLVIKGDDLVTEDEMLYDGDQIEIRPVISGG